MQYTSVRCETGLATKKTLEGLRKKETHSPGEHPGHLQHGGNGEKNPVEIDG
jgi:hypothetical protein